MYVQVYIHVRHCRATHIPKDRTGEVETVENGGSPSLRVKDEQGGLVAMMSLLSIASSVLDCMSLKVR